MSLCRSMSKRELVKRAMTPLSWINGLTKKDGHTILIYSNLGFRDNAYALYEYLIKHGYNKKYHIICSINEYEHYMTKKDNPKNVEYVSPKEGMKRFFGAKYVFYTFGQYPIMPSKDQVVVHMWHGMPLKRIGNLQMGHEKAKHNYFTYVLASSDFFGEIMAKCFGAKENQVLKSFQPKCDRLVERAEENRGESQNEAGLEIKNRILWLPTYRNSKAVDFDAENIKGEEGNYSFASVFKDEEDWIKLDKHLQEIDYEFIIKLHPLERELEEKIKLSNIKIITEEKVRAKGIHMYDMFRTAKALISDYSSSYMDFMLLNRPVAFILADMEKYDRLRGFVVKDPKKYMPGPKLASVDDIIAFIDEVAAGKDTYRDEREKMNDFLNHYEIGKNTGDLLEKVGIVR